MTTSELIRLALAEDMPTGDLTTDRLPLAQKMGRARLIAKEDLVISGLDVWKEVFQSVDPSVQVTLLHNDGQFIWAKQTMSVVEGPLSSLLKAERTALNFVGHLSGIATLTKCFVQQVEHTGCRILDTRKTTPLFRHLEKMAVRHGGGHNHRMNLSESVLIKDNHIRAVGSISAAVKEVIRSGPVTIEVECQSIDQVKESVTLPIHWIMLDNFSDTMIKEALPLIPRNIRTEASGNMKLDRVKRVAEMGVTAISVGALTHSAPVADMSLEFEE